MRGLCEMAARAFKHVAGDAGGHELKPAAATTIQTAARGHVGRCDVQTMRRTFVRVRAAKRMGVSIERLCGLRRPKARGVLEMRWTMIRSTTSRRSRSRRASASASRS